MLLACEARKDVRIKPSGTLFFWVHTPLWGQKHVPDSLFQNCKMSVKTACLDTPDRSKKGDERGVRPGQRFFRFVRRTPGLLFRFRELPRTRPGC